MKYLLLCVLSSALVAVTNANAAEPLTFENAIALAVAQSPDIQARVAEYDAAQSLTHSSGRLPDPELVVGIDNLPITGPDAGSLTSDFMTMRKFGIMQAFPGHSKRELRTELANHTEELALAHQVHTKLEIERQTAQAWIAAYVAEEKLSRLRTLETRFSLQSQFAEAQVKSGRMPVTDAIGTKTALFGLRDRIRSADLDVRRARAELARWVPDVGDRPLTMPPSFASLSKAELLSGVHHHASLLTYDAQLEAARTEIALAEAEKHPDWSVGLMYSKRGSEFSDMVSLEFRVGLPLFVRNRQDPQIAAKRSELRRVEADREAEVRMHTAEITQMIAEWETLSARINSFNSEILPLAKERVDLATAALQSNRGDAKSALDAQVAYIELQIQVIELEGELGKTWAALSYLQDHRSAS